jgi:DNA-binding FadR family transcriptional regulator
MATVEIRGVEKYFGAAHIIRGVDIAIEDGQFAVLVGPSGCGKSTLLRMIAGLEEISGGEIAIGGRVVEPAAVRMAAEHATAQDIAEIEAAYQGMRRAVEEGGDYVTYDLRFHQGLLRACGNRMMIQMSKAIGALLRTSFEISTSRKDGPRLSLPMHRAVLDAVIAHHPAKAERAVLVLIDSARDDIDAVLASRRRLPRLDLPARPLPAA